MADSRFRGIESVYPLTPIQQGILYHTLTNPDSDVFVNQIVMELTGRLDLERLKASWQELVGRHTALRTSFLWDGIDDPLQLVHESASIGWSSHDLSAVANRDSALAALLKSDRSSGFDIATPPLTRMTLVDMGEDKWVWVWTIHHIVVDGWSVQVLLDELSVVYASGQEPHYPSDRDPFDYESFLRSRVPSDRGTDEVFWRKTLGGFTEPHRLTVLGLGRPSDGGYATTSISLDPETSSRLTATAASREVTLNTVIVGAWAIVLSRWARTPDVVFGVTLAGRPPAVAGIDSAVGLFINTLPLRLDVPPHLPSFDWLRQVQRRQVEVRGFETSSLPDVQRWSDVGPGSGLFESIVVFENYPPSAVRHLGAGLELGNTEFIEHSNYPLALLAIPGESLEIRLVFDESRLTAKAAESVATQVATVLDQLSREPDGAVGDIEIVADTTTVRKLEPGAQLGVDDSTIHAMISEVAERSPETPAVVFEDQTITYRELDERAAALAGRLREVGVGPNHPVGVYVQRSIDMIVGILGVLKAGGAYVPLDPSYPVAHIRRILEGGAIDIVVTETSRLAHVPDSISSVAVDTPQSVQAATTEPDVTGDDLAYVIYTSGSTGEPKGVMVTHRNLVQSTRARAVHYERPVGRFLLLSSFAFDSSMVGIFWTLTSGGTLVLPPPMMEQDADGLLELIRREGVTHTLCLPTLYQVLLQESVEDELDSLEVVVVAGEACPQEVLDAHLDLLPATELHNEYGPTEATVWCTVHRASSVDRGAAVPIGRPIAGARVLILDETGHRVPRGFSGELCVAGDGVAVGYLNRPDLTAERFVSIDIDGTTERMYRTGDLGAYRADGAIVFLGRADRQLKIRGHRIEPTAVESAVLSLPKVHDVAVVARSSPGRSIPRLVAYVAGDADQDLAGALRERVPRFMVPDVFAPIDAVPRLPNGKVDYAALPEPNVDANAFAAPETPNEKALATVWAELFGLATIGIDDDFFELGGDSIVSIQMVSRARQAGLQVQPGQVASYPTVRSLAAAVSGNDSVADHASVSGPVEVGPVQRWFFSLELEDPGHWNMSRVFEVAGVADAAALGAALQACVDHHDMLRARFERSGGDWRQVVESDVVVQIDEAGDVDEASLEASIHALQANLDLERGPLVAARLFHGRPDRAAQLLLVIHHLIIDAVSWGILVEDMETAYRQLLAGDPVELPPRTTPFQVWVENLMAIDRSADRWETQLVGHDPRTLLSDVDAGRESNRRAAVASLDRSYTKGLLTNANDAYQTAPQELIVAALADVLAAWRGLDAVTLMMEGHGRPTNVEGVDLSRTIGWLTSAFPVRFEVGGTGSAGLIKSAKESLRSAGGGLEYGVLRYLDHHPTLRSAPIPGAVFNYLSRVPVSRAGALLNAVSSAEPSSRGPANAPPFALEIVAGIYDEVLSVTWHCNSSDLSSVSELATAHMSRLGELLDHCLSGDAGGYTPSDFPEARLSQEELDRFLQGLR